LLGQKYMLVSICFLRPIVHLLSNQYGLELYHRLTQLLRDIRRYLCIQ
jgi:hypothetical protein